MTALYVVLPLALLIASAAVLAFAWVVRSGQLDDVDTPARRILFDDTVVRAPVHDPENAQPLRAGEHGAAAISR
jgi:cbb3-type cytochrome oxidase maturation protein